MVDLSRLRTLFDIEVGDIDITLFSKEGNEKVVQKEERVLVNLAELDDEERRELIDISNDHLEEEGRLLNDPVEEETADIEEGWDEQKAEILDFFDGLIYDRYHQILEKALYLRGVIEQNELTKQQIDKRKNDVADRLGGDAHYIANLCTAGYFDEDRTFREIYQQMYMGEGYQEHEFKDAFVIIVTEQLLCVFVERDQSVYEVKQDVRGTLAKYQREDPPNNYVDIRGIGDHCENIIDKVVSDLEDEYFGFDATEFHEGDQRVIRIHPASLPELGGDYS